MRAEEKEDVSQGLMPEGSVHWEIERLQKAIAFLEHHIDELSNRIDSVLRPEDVPPSDKSNVERPPTSCELASRIRSVDDHAEKLAQRLADLCRRIALT